jgi:chaperone modulatory protein CbpM
MLVTFEAVAAEIQVDKAELAAWIEQSWVLPVEEKGRFLFDEADVARVRLIAELHRDLGVNEEAVPVVLRLLDQVYTLRKALDDLNTAIQALPEAFRQQLKSELSKVSKKPERDRG